MNREKVSGPSILIVEDDSNLRLGLCDNLKKEGYRTQSAANGVSARALLSNNKGSEGRFDLVILDIMLPDTDGYTLCREIRAGKDQPMIMMLTARTLEDDLVRGFDAGADDYLEKPYRLRELLSRVRALLRRRDTGEPRGVYTFGHFTLETSSRKVSGADGDEVDFTRREFDMLHLFLRRAGQALTRDIILDKIWGKEVYVDERTVDNFVSNIKKKLGWTHDSGYRIETIRGVGYRMEIDDSTS